MMMKIRAENIVAQVLTAFVLTLALAGPNAALSEIVRPEVGTTAAAIED